MRNTTLAALVAVLLGGCSMVPDYQRPTSPVPQEWLTGTPQAALDQARVGQASPALGADFVRSAELRALIDRALANNRDLRIAALNIEKARAVYRIERSSTIPALNAGASMARQRTPETLSPSASTATKYAVDIGSTAFELDLFGRVRSLEASALEQYLATREGREAATIALVAEVADAYLTLLADRNALALARETLQAQERSVDLTRVRAELGEATGLDVAQASSGLHAARGSLERALLRVDQDTNAIALLIGSPVNEGDLRGVAAPEVLLTEVPAGLRSDILLARPDIAQAEHRLKAANADIGAARAAFYPRITLTGSAGLGSASLADLFSGGAGLWSFAPAVSLPIFDGGRNQANFDAALAGRDIAVAEYEKSIQSAFREVADALAARASLTTQAATQADLIEAASLSHRLASRRHALGLESYLSVLDAQRTLYAARQTQIEIDLARSRNAVTLFRALGGRWRAQ